MRVRKKPWAEGELSSNNLVIGNPSAYKGKWNELFEDSNPIHIEIGCGKGGFLTQTAADNPRINYVGIERQKSIIAVAARKAAEQGLINVRYICGDVVALADFFADNGEISRIYINFCDPWPKKKWVKRRLTYRSFLAVYTQLMGAGKSEVFLKTDNTVLFESSLNEFSGSGWMMKNITFDLHNSGYEANIMTEYEKKFSLRGLPIYRLEAYK